VTVKFKLESPAVEEEQEAAPPPPKKSHMPLSKGPVPMQPDGDPKTVWPMLEDIRSRLIRIEGLLNGAPALPEPIKTQNGHPVAKNGTVAQFIEVPSVEQVIAAAKKYKARYGQDALAQALENFKAKKISDLDDEQKALFVERLSDDKPEGLEE
jgi:hypothetical protein